MNKLKNKKNHKKKCLVSCDLLLIRFQPGLCIYTLFTHLHLWIKAELTAFTMKSGWYTLPLKLRYLFTNVCSVHNIWTLFSLYLVFMSSPLPSCFPPAAAYMQAICFLRVSGVATRQETERVLTPPAPLWRSAPRRDVCLSCLSVSFLSVKGQFWSSDRGIKVQI